MKMNGLKILFIVYDMIIKNFNIKTDNMKLKTSLNFWEISFKEESLQLSTIFNSGFIDDINIVKEFFIKTNPNASEITINKKFL